MRVLLDLGLPKTGSKTRQQLLTTQLHRVSGLRAHYVQTGRQGPWHRPLYESLAADDRSLVDALVKELETKVDRADLAILSYKELYKLDQDRIQYLKDSLPELTALIFLSRQDDIVNSFRNQLHKAHRIPPRDLGAFETRMLDYLCEYDYRAILER